MFQTLMIPIVEVLTRVVSYENFEMKRSARDLKKKGCSLARMVKPVFN